MERRVDTRTVKLQSRSTQIILAASSNPKEDLQAERSQSTIDTEQLSYLLNGGKDVLAKRKEFAAALSQTPWGDKSRRYFLSREEEYVGALRAALGIWEKMKLQNLTLQDGALMRLLVDFPGGLELHIGMFIPSILSQGTAEQQAHWLPKCLRLEVIGTYAQTELAHGTFVRGLETTATYDPETQEFVLHSPTLTSTKWWPGGLGKTASHAVVMARLFVSGQDHGPHAFVVQLRSLEDHMPLPGIHLGDIGPKLGYNGVDNGFLQLDHVRIPREHMLMRYAQVTADGQYLPPPPDNAKASYATMLYVRADIVKNAGSQLGKAVTIATRYAAVRRQTAARPGEKELQVLDYQNVAHTLLPTIASAYALHFMGDTLFTAYKEFEQARERGVFSALPELHAMSSGLKALCTWITADGIEKCRRTCGGHGYSRLSGLPTLFENYVQPKWGHDRCLPLTSTDYGGFWPPLELHMVNTSRNQCTCTTQNVTWEGDNNVLCLQTARYLLKAHTAAKAGQAVDGSADYLVAPVEPRSAATCPDCWGLPAVQIAALQHRAARLINLAVATLVTAAGGRLVFEGKAWNDNTVILIRMANAHGLYVLHNNFVSTLKKLQERSALPSSTLSVLQQLASLFVLTSMEDQLGDLLEDGFVTGEQASHLRQHQLSLLRALRPNAVALVDAFAFEDYVLNSALGRADGDVYNSLYQMAQGSPLNSTPEGAAWHSVLKPVMTAKSKL